MEETGELKMLSGLRSFHKAEVVEVEGLSPRVDSPAWSMMAWVKLPQNGGATILRKPLRSQHQLSCWYEFSPVRGSIQWVTDIKNIEISAINRLLIWSPRT
jgi:hypothetical protein